MPLRSADNVIDFREKLIDELCSLSKADALYEVEAYTRGLIETSPSEARALAYKKLNVFPFKDVKLCWRRAYEEACLFEIYGVLGDEATCGVDRKRELSQTAEDEDDWIRKVVHLCDNAIIFTGAPKRRQLLDSILEAVDDQVLPRNVGEELGTAEISDEPQDGERASKRRRIQIPSIFIPDEIQKATGRAIPSAFPLPPPHQPIPSITPSHRIPRLEAPSLNTFSQHMKQAHTPLIFTNTLSHWPALSRWRNPKYWLGRTHGGRRLIPVELGRSYTDEGWGQKIMEFGEYLERYVLELKPESDPKKDGNGENGGDTGGEQDTMPGKRKGYLAQHDLLTQIPALRNDIAVPDYCYLDPPKPPAPDISASTDGRPTSRLSTSSASAPEPPGPSDARDDESQSLDEDNAPPQDPTLNIWLGPAGTISPAHTDLHENILAQVVGRKYVRLFPPSEGRKMYPMGVVRYDGQGDDVDHGGKDGGEVDELGDEEEIDEPETEASPKRHRRKSEADEQDAQDLRQDHDGDKRGKDEGISMHNTSFVDVGAFVDWQYPTSSEQEAHHRALHWDQTRRFPEHSSAPYVEAILEAGECLYIPRGWWHFVASLEASVSVSFWWG